MKEAYSVPVYNLEPEPGENEQTAFRKWFDKKYYDLNSQPPPREDDTELSKIRDSIGDFAKGLVQQESGGSAQETAEGGETGITGLPEERILKLPSRQAGAEAGADTDKNPLDRPIEGLDSMNEKTRSFFDHEVDRSSGLFELIREKVGGSFEDLAESLYLNEYIVSAFKCATTVNNRIKNDIGRSRPLDKTFFENGEVEYIIFGGSKESSNIGRSKLSIFAIRLPFNLLHVYTDPDKLSAALTLANALAGWTIFGIPVVHNFLLVSWAALESYVDLKALFEGKSVPLVKTSSSWYLSADNMADFLKNIFLKDLSQYAGEQFEEKVGDVSEALEETAMDMIDGKIDEAFAPFETGLDKVTDAASETVKSEVSALVGNEFLSGIDFDNMDSFADSLENTVNDYVAGSADKLESLGEEELSGFKSALKERVRALIFESGSYKDLIDRAKAVGKDLINNGVGAVEERIDKVFGENGASRSSNITGRLVMMDYADYLRLILLAVPDEKKALRTADLMQLNMQEAAGNDDISMDQYDTYITVKAEIDMNTWFLPEQWFREGNRGMISAEWSQGY